MCSESASLPQRRHALLLRCLVFVSGAAALGHQFLWSRRLVDLLGASSESSARVFGTFFLGLSVGAALSAVVAHRVTNPLRLAGFVQLAIPVLILPVIFVSELTDWVWPVVGADATHGSTGDMIKSLMTLGLVLPPCVMMGLSFPLVVAGLLRHSGGDLGRFGIGLYAINTLGGACGILLFVVLVVPWLGNFGAMLLAGAVDGLAGVGLILYSVLAGASQADPALAGSPQTDSGLRRWTLALAFFTGMTVLSLEVAALQMFQLVATISLYSPAAVLFSAIASLGLAAVYFSRRESAWTAVGWPKRLVIAFVVSGVLVSLSPQVFIGIASRSNWFAGNTSVVAFVVKLTALSLVSMGPAWFVSGLIFPFAIAVGGRRATPTQCGRRLGLLLAVNGIGGLIGAELTYRCWLPMLGIYGTVSAIGLSFGLAGLAVALFTTRISGSSVDLAGETSGRPPGLLPTFTASAVMLLVLPLAFANLFLPSVNPPPGVTPLDVRSGREGTVAVLESRQGERSILVSNQYMLGGTSVRYDQERQVLLPLVLHEQPSSVACIGLATGITPGAALTIPEVQDVTAIELSPLVARAAGAYFDDFNHGIIESEKAAVVIGDGRTYIASTRGRFDVITGDLFLPWAPGVSRLYSYEHFVAVRRALKADGIFCQWLPMHQLTPEQVGLIADTFAAAFGETHLFVNHFRVHSPMLALVGWKDSAGVDWDRVGRRCERLRKLGAIQDPVLRHGAGVRLLSLGALHANPRALGRADPSRRVTLSDPTLEYSAAAVRLSLDPAAKYFHPKAWINFCRSRLPRRSVDNTAPNLGGDVPGASDVAVAKYGSLATGLMELQYATLTGHELRGAIASRVSEAMPSSLTRDHSADWNRWPGPTPDLLGRF